jgi:transposase
LVRRPADRTIDEQGILLVTSQHDPAIASLVAITDDFTRLVRDRIPAGLDPWLETVQPSAWSEMKRFANGMQRDDAAMQAALEESWRNGQTEGQVHRLQFLKRQSSGRAGFDLLRKRVLLAG